MSNRGELCYEVVIHARIAGFGDGIAGTAAGFCGHDCAAQAKASMAGVTRVTDLIGVRVYNPSDENLGKIENLVIDPASGQIRYAVLSFGGFLGMGDKLFACLGPN